MGWRISKDKTQFHLASLTMVEDKEIMTAQKIRKVAFANIPRKTIGHTIKIAISQIGERLTNLGL